jgi:hypothetical protein
MNFLHACYTPHSCSATSFSNRECPGGGCVGVYSPRHSARPFHHIRSSIACLHPPHPPVTPAPAALPQAVRATSFAPSPVPSSLLLSSSPTPLSAAPAWRHTALYCLLYSVVYYATHACPQRPEGAPPTSPKRRRSPLESQHYKITGTRYLYVIG